MLKEKARVFWGSLLAAELAVWSVGFGIAYQTRTSLVDTYGFIAPITDYLPILVVALAVWSGYSLTGGWRSSQRTRPMIEEIGSIGVATALVALSTMAVIFLAKMEANSRLFIGLWELGSALSILLGRVVLRSFLRSARTRGYNTRKVAIVGEGDTAAQVARSLDGRREWGLQFVGFIVPDTTTAIVEPGPEAPAGTPTRRMLGRMSDMARIVDANVIDEVIFVVDGPQLHELEHSFSTCEEAGVSTRIVLDFFPHKISRMQLDDMDGFPTLAFHATQTSEVELLLKRVFDLVVAVLAVLVGAPVFAAVAVAVKLSSPGPVLFVQRRVGLQGRAFNVFKFRSMVVDAEARQQALLDANEMSGPVFKIKEDPRVTRVGRFLRRTSLDEIPQFFNVLLGDMSVVGPRPSLPSELERYERWQRRRLSMKPGITCIWQVSGRNDVDFATWMRQDLQYIDNWSLWLDLKIFLQTIPAVLFARGAR